MRRIDDDPFNAGWNACLDEIIKCVKALPSEAVAKDGVRVLIAKSTILDMLRQPSS